MIAGLSPGADRRSASCMGSRTLPAGISCAFSPCCGLGAAADANARRRDGKMTATAGAARPEAARRMAVRRETTVRKIALFMRPIYPKHWYVERTGWNPRAGRDWLHGHQKNAW